MVDCEKQLLNKIVKNKSIRSYLCSVPNLPIGQFLLHSGFTHSFILYYFKPISLNLIYILNLYT